MKYYIVIAALLSLSTLAQAQTQNTPQPRAGIMREGTKTLVQQKRPEEKMGSTTRPIMNKMATSTKKMMDERKSEFKVGSTSRPLMNKVGSTTKGMMGERKEEKRELKMTERKDVALAQKDFLIKRLTMALENLSRTKISLDEYITKRTSENKPVGKAKELMVTANTKIEAAKKAVAAIVAWKPDAKAASTTEISLTKPRETANVAIKAVQEARMAIAEVIKELRSQIKPIKEVENNQ